MLANDSLRQRKIREVLLLLLDAYECAVDVGASVWDFALEVKQLRERGLNDNDLRWLTSKGYAEHALETTLLGDVKRYFRPAGPLKFTGKSCFVLSAAGVDVAIFFRTEAQAGSTPESACESEGVASKPVSAAIIQIRADADYGDPIPQPCPVWDSQRHELWLGNTLVKRFAQPSPNQEAVLAAFHEENWPACIADPLPPAPEIDPKRRLQDTIKALNNNQKTALLHFKGDGTGQGVVWELCRRNGQLRKSK